MNAVYPLFMEALSQAQVDATSVSWAIVPVDETAIYDTTNSVLGDIAASVVGAGVALPFDGLTNDGVTAVYGTSGTLVFNDITSADTVQAYVIVADSGGLDLLAAWIDTRADGTPVLFIGTGSPISVEFPSLWFLRP